MWKIEKNQPTIFNGETIFKEHINTNMLNRIIESGYDTRNREGYSIRNFLIRIYKAVKNDNLYVYPELHSCGYGRAYYPKGISISMIPRDFRHTLLKDSEYIDYDIDNAHFNILYQLCKKNNVPLNLYKNIKLYCENRENIIEDTIIHFFGKKDLSKRSSVKQLFIRMGLYLGGFNTWKKEEGLDEKTEATTLLLCLKNEVRKITEEYVKKENPEIWEELKEELKDKKKDIYSTLISHFLCNEERKIIECIYNELSSKKIIRKNNFIYCYDGFMLPKTDKNILDMLPKITKKTTGFNLSWSIKPFTENIMNNIIEYENKKDYTFQNDIFYNIVPTEEECKLVWTKGKPEMIKLNRKLYERQKEYFERYNFRVTQNASYVRVVDKEMNIYSLNKYSNIYKHLSLVQVDDDGKMKRIQNKKESSFLQEWYCDKDARVYENMNFLPYPLSVPSFTYNTFKNFDIEKNIHGEDENYDIIINHIHNLVGGKEYDKDKKNLDYMLDYLADIVQNPGTLPEIALLFKSIEGVGKNLFFDNFGRKILGKKYYLQTDNIEMLLGRFNSNNNKVLIVMDETSGKDTFTKKENIKNLITQPVLNFEKKHVDVFEINNVGRYIFLSNNDVPISISLTDRRFVCFESVMPLPKKTKLERKACYFDPLLKAFDDEDICKSFYDFLKKREIKDLKQRPITHLYKEIQKSSIPIELQFLEYYCCKNMEEALRNNLSPFSNVKATDLYKDFKKWVEKYNNNTSSREKTATKFKAKLKQIFKNNKEVFEINRTTNNYCNYTFQYQNVLDFMEEKNLLID